MLSDGRSKVTAFRGGDAVQQAREVMEQAKITELGRIADALVDLGRRNAPKPTVTWMNLANECASIGNALEQILDSDMTVFEKAKLQRKLLEDIRKYQQKYLENYEQEVLEQTGGNDATE